MAFSTQRRLTAEEFNTALTPELHRRLAPHRIDSARRVMVDGEQVQAVADDMGVSRNAISLNVKLVWDHLEEIRGTGGRPAGAAADPVVLPPDWGRRTFVAPLAVLERWSEELRSMNLAPPPAKKRGRGATRQR